MKETALFNCARLKPTPRSDFNCVVSYVDVGRSRFPRPGVWLLLRLLLLRPRIIVPGDIRDFHTVRCGTTTEPDGSQEAAKERPTITLALNIYVFSTCLPFENHSDNIVLPLHRIILNNDKATQKQNKKPK